MQLVVQRILIEELMWKNGMYKYGLGTDNDDHPCLCLVDRLKLHSKLAKN